jgi:hypothetical protein
MSIKNVLKSVMSHFLILEEAKNSLQKATTSKDHQILAKFDPAYLGYVFPIFPAS